MKPLPAFLLAIAACGAATATTLDFSRPGMLNVQRGRFATGSETQVTTDAGGTAVSLDPSRTKPGEPVYYSLGLKTKESTDWRNRRLELVVRFGSRPAVRKSLSLDFIDSHGEVFRFKPVETWRDGDATHLVYSIVADGVSCPSWGKTRNGRFDGSIRLVALLGSYASEAAGTIVYVSLRDLPDSSGRGVGSLEFDADVGDPLKLLRGRLGPIALTFRNLSRERRTWRGKVAFCDFFGRSFRQDVDVSAEGGETVRVAANDVPYKGIWFVSAELAGDDGSHGTVQTRFAAIDRHDASPHLRKPHFRMGINFHAQKFANDPKRFALVLDALTASGAKLARIGGMKFCDNVPREGEPVWTMCDRIVRAVRERGIAINANLYPGPAWAQKPLPGKLAKERHRMNFPTRNGLFRDYCYAFAARYGSEIDYFEIGNEWDLTPASVLPPDEAFRLMDEGYDGVKAGSPSGTVITCGWTLGATGKATAEKNPGLLEAFHAKAPFDVWPLHVHGAFSFYRTELQTRFFPLRDRVGRGKPWYSNETAMTTAGCAEEEAAQTVWKKILYAWAWGSTDYIWYNLCATDPRDSDSEGGYGLMNGTDRPRTTYAAFAALATLVHGSERPERIDETASRFVCRFRLADGRGIVYAGWDDSPSPAPVRLPAPNATRIDMMGNASPLAGADGALSWTPGVNPEAVIVRD